MPDGKCRDFELPEEVAPTASGNIREPLPDHSEYIVSTLIDRPLLAHRPDAVQPTAILRATIPRQHQWEAEALIAEPYDSGNG